MTGPNTRKGEEVLARFSRIAELDSFARERAELIREITDIALGHIVVVTDLDAATLISDGEELDGEHPIERLTIRNPQQSDRYLDGRIRRYGTNGREYVPNAFFRFIPRIKGDVVGVDSERAGLIVRHKTFVSVNDDSQFAQGDRYWVDPVDKNGVPTVNLHFRD